MSQQLAAFRPNTRQRIQKVGQLAASFASTQSITFPQVGLLSRIFLWANLTLSDAAASPATAINAFCGYPFNVLKRITGATNLGTATVFDLSGYGAYQVDKITDTSVETAKASGDQTTDNMFQYTTTGYVQNTAKVLQFVVMIPVALNDGPQFSLGLINLQAPEIRFTLTVQFGQSSDALASADAITLGGNVNVYYQYYEVPDPSQVALPPRVLHRLIEDRTTITSTGDTTYLVPRQGVLLQMIHALSLNGAISKNSTDLTNMRLVFNKTDTPYNYVDIIVARMLNRFRYGFSGNSNDLPAGTWPWDFFDADQAPTRGDLRDAVDTEALSTLESIFTISSGATLGSNNNFLDTVRRITQNY